MHKHGENSTYEYLTELPPASFRRLFNGLFLSIAYFQAIMGFTPFFISAAMQQCTKERLFDRKLFSCNSL